MSTAMISFMQAILKVVNLILKKVTKLLKIKKPPAKDINKPKAATNKLPQEQKRIRAYSTLKRNGICF